MIVNVPTLRSVFQQKYQQIFVLVRAGRERLRTVRNSNVLFLIGKKFDDERRETRGEG